MRVAMGLEAVSTSSSKHVAMATTSMFARIYNMTELFEQRHEAFDSWSALLEREMIGREVAVRVNAPSMAA